MGSQDHYTTHLHVPGTLSEAVMLGDGEARMKSVEFHSRLNKQLELVKAGTTGKLNASPAFNWLGRDQLRALNSRTALMSKIAKLDDNRDDFLVSRLLKVTGVGQQRLSGIDPSAGENEYTKEIRYVPFEKKDFNIAFANGVQKNVITGEMDYYGIPSTQFHEWYQAHVGAPADPTKEFEKQQELLENLHYNRPATQTDLMQMEQMIGKNLAAPVFDYVFENGDENYGLRMLTFGGWEDDPVLWKNKEALDQVNAAQKKALTRLSQALTTNGGALDPSDPTVRKIIMTFARKSGLYDVYSKSLGMPPLDPWAKADPASQ
jgi:hypothetical protein